MPSKLYVSSATMEESIVFGGGKQGMPVRVKVIVLSWLVSSFVFSFIWTFGRWYAALQPFAVLNELFDRSSWVQSMPSRIVS